MFFVDSDNKIINVNAIMILPEVTGNLGGIMVNVLMIDGSYQNMYAVDVEEIRALVISRQLSPHTN